MTSDKIDKQLSHYYDTHILKILEAMSKDRLYQFIDQNDYERLYDKLNDFWLEINKIDIEHGHTPHGNIFKDKYGA